MIEQLHKFLIERKISLLDQQRYQPNQRVKDMFEAQIRVIESILIFLNNNKEREDVDMSTLQLSLDKEARSLDEIKSRKGSGELAQAIKALADSLKPNTFKQVNTEQVKGRSIAAKVYFMKKTGLLPESISVITRGKELFITRKA